MTKSEQRLAKLLATVAIAVAALFAYGVIDAARAHVEGCSAYVQETTQANYDRCR